MLWLNMSIICKAVPIRLPLLLLLGWAGGNMLGVGYGYR